MKYILVPNISLLTCNYLHWDPDPFLYPNPNPTSRRAWQIQKFWSLFKEVNQIYDASYIIHGMLTCINDDERNTSEYEAARSIIRTFEHPIRHAL